MDELFVQDENRIAMDASYARKVKMKTRSRACRNVCLLHGILNYASEQYFA
jgi:hypothetical protein